jgi:carboxyl-terminal processing protease
MKRSWLIVLACAAGCGGGGGGGAPTGANPPGSGTGSGSGGNRWLMGSYLPAESFAAQCALPRQGVDPYTGQAYPDVQGSTFDENMWLRSWSNDLYLWYDEIVDRDPSADTTQQYFGLLKTFATTPSGQPKDRFHFSLPTATWRQFSQSGVNLGYGVGFAFLSTVPPRSVVVAYTEPDSPAALPPASLKRGDRVIAVDGFDIDVASSATLNAAFSPTQSGETHSFTIRESGAGTIRTVVLQAANVAASPVQDVQTLSTPFGPVGYLLFNDHVAAAEPALIDAFERFKEDGVVDLVLDLRYNGGGYLVLASEVAYMIAGAATAGRTFEEVRFNDKHPSTDPVTGAALAPLPFQSTAVLSAFAGPLPTLDLSRVFVLTGATTCSASESIMNSLLGIDIEVVQIGTETCGKPYGFYPADNCGTTYFSIQFKGVNEKGFGDYADGFSPVMGASAETEGCLVGDDFDHALGDPAEARFDAALSFREAGACQSTALSSSGVSKPGVTSPLEGGRVYKSPWLENRILGVP